MICPNCGASINSNYDICPYCKTGRQEGLAARKLQDDRLEKRFERISNVIDRQINEEFFKLRLAELERYYTNILKLTANNQSGLTVDEITKLDDHLFRVFEHLQNRYPIRKDIDSTLNNINNYGTFNNNLEVVQFLILKSMPPQFNAAGFKLRSCCERALQDIYMYKVFKTPKGYRFEKTYLDMFKEITKNTKDAKLLCSIHLDLNLFVHESRLNDIELSKKFKSDEEKKSFLIKVLNLHNKYNLIQ